ncbi:MAG TPA: class I SAM-dependent methyltransferase [Solirubrobacteraceae bacterium]
MAASPDRTARADARAAISSVPSWYHTIEVGPGVVTQGAFDLRPIVGRLPWPDVRGRRCLDVGTYDGFLAFELERRGAAEVVAVDLPSYEYWDWELHQRRHGPEYMRRVAGPEVGAGVRIARELLGSSVRLEKASAYDLDPSSIGSFDVVVCGSLLLHLRDPLRALAAIRSVCSGEFMSTNHIALGLTALHPRRPVFRLDGTSGVTQWWLANRAGHAQLLRAAGFEILTDSGLYSVPFGPAHTPGRWRPRELLRKLERRALTGHDGVPHHALLARPA